MNCLVTDQVDLYAANFFFSSRPKDSPSFVKIFVQKIYPFVAEFIPRNIISLQNVLIRFFQSSTMSHSEVYVNKIVYISHGPYSCYIPRLTHSMLFHNLEYLPKNTNYGIPY